MATDHSDKLYQALINKNESEVLSLVDLDDKGPMQVVNINQDSVLHIALYSMQVDLVGKLLDKLPKDHTLMMNANAVGNTILHEAVTYDKFQPVAKRMLEREPKLVTAMNNNKETPLFRAARYGQMKMFKLLDNELKQTWGDEKAKECHKKSDGSTILHATIDAEHFELAIRIAEQHEYLHDKKNHENLTALQLLACNPLAFKFRGEGWLKRFIDSRIKSNNVDEDSSHLHEGRVTSAYSVPWWDEMVKKRKRYNAVVKLAKLLIEKDTSWKATLRTTDAKTSGDEEDAHKSVGEEHAKRYGESKTEAELKKIGAKLEKIGAEMKKIGDVVKKTDQDEQKKIEADKKKDERQQTPLLLATQTGCFEIVKEILKVHPQAVEQIDEDGRCILHIAIKYRQMVVFNMVQGMELPMRRLIRKCDAKGNSILHMVGKKVRNEDVEETAKRSPSFQLQDDLLLFERIKKVIRPHFHKHRNHDGETAEELLALNKEALRDKSQEWLKRTAENCSIVAVLIATVAFAAAYTVPGGSNPDNGSPVLLNQTFFVIFTIGDVLSLTFCLTAVIIFLSILTSSFELREFKQSLPQKLMLGITCLILAVTMMMLAFAATIILMIRNNEQWTRIALYTVAFLPVTVFAGVYMPLYLSLMGTFKYTLKKIGSYFPRSNCKNIDQSQIEAIVPVVYTTTRSPTAENSQSLV